MTRAECLRRIVGVLESDARVRGVWLAGSLGRGGGDAFSDLDLVVAVDAADRPVFADSWEAAVGAVVPLVLHQRLDVGPTVVLSHVCDDWIRFDLAVVPAAELAGRDPRATRTLFDRASLTATMAGRGEPLGPDGPAVAALTTEFLRCLGLLPVVVGRGEWEVGASGSGLIRSLLVQLMLQDARVPDRGGALALRGVLRDAHLRELHDLPPIEASRESVVAVHLAVTAAFLPLARALTAETGRRWPDEVEEALRRHLDRSLGLSLPG